MTIFGQNIGYVDELYRRYLEDPSSVSEAWREFFADYRSDAPPATAVRSSPAPTAEAAPAAQGGELVEMEPLSGAQARVVENMAQSLAIPTATSARTIPVKLLEENRHVINLHEAAVCGSKVSFTHLIAWGVVRALEKHPAMNTAYVEVEGRPNRRHRSAIHLGIAVDAERRGERVLLVPNVKNAASLDFPTFLAAYDDLVSRARRGQLRVEDLADTTVTLTNPGTIGTTFSIARLMAGQGTIVGVGAIGYPAEYAGVSPQVISELALSKVMTVTSTYDHRIIQGAESGAFLATLESLIQGADAFYDRIFSELGVPHNPHRLPADRIPPAGVAAEADEAIAKQAGVLQLIRAYRVRGHLAARTDPLGEPPQPHPDLELSTYGLTVWDLDRSFMAGGLAGHDGKLPLREILDILRDTYCRHIGVEYMHIQEPEIRRWLQGRMERTRNADPLPREAQRRILEKLNQAEAFEKFLHSTYVGQKRFSLEGAETLVPMLALLLDDAAEAGIEEVVIGTTHRGRLNLLANIVGKSYTSIFREFEGEVDPASTHGSGDVRYHLGATGTYAAAAGRPLSIEVASNPSHLEAVDPVVEGMTRAEQDRLGDSARERVLALLIHGDAAFAGQGVMAETLHLSQLKGYRTGGTAHIVVNNQIGFTTAPADARSSTYATDVARTVGAPILHVNGDRPEDAVRVVRLALAFRRAFKRDVVVDLVCYRRWGHNEADDPSYTHPILYRKIESHRSVRKLYTEELLRRGDLSPDEAERALEDYRRTLEQAFEEVKTARAEAARLEGPTEREEPPVAVEEVPTGAERARLEQVLAGLERVPPGFHTHPKLARQLRRRREQFEADRVDWALAEALAFGTLAIEKTPGRLSGEDSGRGTFSQRHAVLYDHETGEPYAPLAHLSPDQATFQVYDSLLSEFAVLGFEYGYSVKYPQALVMWEAQFGDFANGAQVVIDQFVVSAEEKWGQKSGLTMLLPHGYEGQGPEHSSARVERFLELASRGNIRVCWPTTPAQYFHLLRRQARLEPRKPLVALTPKSLLRHPRAISTVAELEAGRFEEVLADPESRGPEAVRRVVWTSGKLWYELAARRREAGGAGVVLLRIEQLYPYPAAEVSVALARLAHVRDVVWAQEEPRNMGAWGFLEERLRGSLAPGQTLRFVGRPRNASPATGSHRRHLAEQRALVEAVFQETAVKPGEPAAQEGVRS